MQLQNVQQEQMNIIDIFTGEKAILNLQQGCNWSMFSFVGLDHNQQRNSNFK